MRIAVIGWGSLVYDPRDLSIVDEPWQHDGPCFPIEFARIPDGHRLTLVIAPGFDLVSCLYATFSLASIKAARPLSVANACRYLRSLSDDHFHGAKKYILNTPNHVKTRFRSALEAYIEQAGC